MTEILNQARGKLAEIANEKSIPEDAITLFGLVIDSADAADGATADEFAAIAANGAALAARVTALEERPQAQVSAEGFDLAPIENAKIRISQLREAGAIPGNLATVFEDFLAAFGTREAPPAPPPGNDPTPPAPEPEAPAAETGAASGDAAASTETPAAPQGDGGQSASPPADAPPASGG